MFSKLVHSHKPVKISWILKMGKCEWRTVRPTKHIHSILVMILQREEMTFCKGSQPLMNDRLGDYFFIIALSEDPASPSNQITIDFR